MKPVNQDNIEEITSLVATLREAGQRLEELTGGEVDSVVDWDGSTILMRGVHDQLRQVETVRQSAILNALPAYIALLDGQGVIVSTNEAWLQFGKVNGGLGGEIGVNYLLLCDSALGNDSSEADRVGAGIRAVLDGSLETFSIEYPCNFPGGRHWYLMSVSPLTIGPSNGAVVMHLNITDRKQATESLRSSMEEFRSLAEAMPQIVWMAGPDGMVSYSNQHWMEYTGLTPEESLGLGWNKPFHPDEKQRVMSAWQHAATTRAIYSNECRLRRADGVYRWWLIRGVPMLDAAGNILKWFGTCTDIHDLKVAELNLLATNGVLRENEVAIKRLNRVYAVLSSINMLIVRARNRDELFREACLIATDKGGFRMALLAIVDQGTSRVVPVASSGMGGDLLNAVDGISNLHPSATNSLISRTVKDKATTVSNSTQNEALALLRDENGQAGIHALAVLPLTVANEVAGVYCLYADDHDFFHQAELRLLEELAGDISFAIDHIDKNERLDHLAYYDALTGLANRVLFQERFEQGLITARDQKEKLGLVFLDVERFKVVNDTLGRLAGDAVLKEVAARLWSHAADDTRLARIDADHFALFFPEITAEEQLARRIEKIFEQVFGPPFHIGDIELRISARVGIAMFPADGSIPETLLRNAEAALENAKASARPYLFYTESMNTRVAGKLTLENQLRQALDNNEFVLYYQPKVMLATGILTGAEALIRWNNPRTGLVPPNEFIPMLEETGLIHPVGQWAMRTAVTDYLRWHAAGLAAVRVSVNVSPLQLRQRDFLASIEKTVGMDPLIAAGLELEITEGVIMEDILHSITSLTAIRALGVTVAIDDFGTGFSSLSYLAKLPVDSLKIDRSFVIDMTASPGGLALVSTIIGLAHALNLKVVAEGVETEAQSQLLRLLKCEEMQGFLFSKPVPTEIFEAKFLAPPQSTIH